MLPRLESKIVVAIVTLATLLRIVVAALNIQLIHPDEHFQVLEPAYQIVSGIGIKAWEWDVGLRSWIAPSLFVPVVWSLNKFGIEHGPILIVACRLLIALLGFFFLWGFYRTLRFVDVPSTTSLLALCLIGFSPTMVIWGASTLTENISATIIWGSLPFILRNIYSLESPSIHRMALSGFLIALPFAIRIQNIVIAAPMLLFGIWIHRKSIQAVSSLLLGFNILFLVVGIIDYFTWGNFFHSTYTNWIQNIVRKVSNQYGVSPWYDYFSRIIEFFDPITGIFLWAGTQFFIFLVLQKLAVRQFKVSTKALFIFVPLISYFVVHSLISHKETRFIYPLIPVLFLMFSMGLQKFSSEFTTKTLAMFAIALSCIQAVLSLQARIGTKTDMSELSAAIYPKIEKLTRPTCIVLHRTNWVDTRGMMMFGDKITYKTIHASLETHLPVTNCDFVFAKLENVDDETLRKFPNWQRTKQTKYGMVLVERLSRNER